MFSWQMTRSIISAGKNFGGSSSSAGSASTGPRGPAHSTSAFDIRRKRLGSASDEVSVVTGLRFKGEDTEVVDSVLACDPVLDDADRSERPSSAEKVVDDSELALFLL
jgi:hypothetical protein